MHKIAILSYNNTALFELGCAVELFALPRPEIQNWYQSEVVSLDQGPHQTTAGIRIHCKRVASLSAYDTLIIPSWPTHITQVKGLLANQIKQFHKDGKRILSFCSGAFLLASLGILNGRKATTHWQYATKFKKRYRQVNYIGDVLYVYAGQIGCSAGSAAAIDLGLAVIREDYGYQISNQVARRLVMSAHRKGGQSQFIETPILESPGQFAHAIDWAIKHIQTPFTVEHFADKANMSRRTFDRKFRSSFNQTPKEWLTDQKLHVAKQLLEDRQTNIETIAGQSGFSNATTMRHHFRKSLGVSPRQYRDQFSTSNFHH